MLLNLYGNLLTDKQQEYTRLHYEQGVAYSAIASKAGVTRQSIFDTVQKATDTLMDIESKLGVIAQNSKSDDAESKSDYKKGMPLPIDTMLKKLEVIRRRIMHERVMYNTDWLLRDIDMLISALKRRK